MSDSVVHVSIPPNRVPERLYAVSVVLEDILSVRYSIRTRNVSHTTIRVGDSKSTLTVADHFFATPKYDWLKPSSLPTHPLPQMVVAAELPDLQLVEPSIPIIYGRTEGDWIAKSNGSIHCNVDVFGSAFFMLTRYEELVLPFRDEHNRFPAAASVAFREGFLQRPIIDEYSELLWTCIERLWPGMKRCRRQSRITVSHDVDWPHIPRRGVLSTFKSAASDLVLRKSPDTAFRRLVAYASKGMNDYTVDPFNTFNFLMDCSEQCGLRSSFYFIPMNSHHKYDGEYSLDDPWIQDLMHRIHTRGHILGLHASYNTYDKPHQIRSQFERLLAVADRLKIRQPEWGGRHHYLQWEAPVTWQAWAEAGLAYDSTVGYADCVGFRSGTCHEHTVFDVLSGTSLALREKPLIAMETTLLHSKYMGLSYPEAISLAVTLHDRCKAFGGEFTLLWHNSHFLRRYDRTAYQAILGC